MLCKTHIARRTSLSLAFVGALYGSANADVLLLGPGGFTTLAAAVNAANAGDTINIQAGTYLNQTAIIGKPLTLVGINGTPVFLGTQPLDNAKGFIVADASLTVNNIQFKNAFTPLGDNGAGIRYQAGDLTVLNSLFVGNQDGILATPTVFGTGHILVQDSTFLNNGIPSGQSGSGLSHALYANQVASLTVTGSTFEGTQVGHNIKSRAAITTITNNYLDDGVTGTTSYAIDLSNGGVATISGNTIVQGPQTQNPFSISYGPEGLVWPTNSANISGNLFTNSLPGGVAINNFTSVPDVFVTGNIFNGWAGILVGPGVVSDNLINAEPPQCGLPGQPPCGPGPSEVPEPSSILALILGAAGILVFQRRRPLAWPSLGMS